jgi:hypothetical protein
LCNVTRLTIILVQAIDEKAKLELWIGFGNEVA